MQHSRLTDTNSHTLESWVQLLWTSNREQDRERLYQLISELLDRPSTDTLPTEPSGLEMAEILRHLDVDQATLITALAADPYFTALKTHQIVERFGVQTQTIVENFRALQDFTRLTPKTVQQLNAEAGTQKAKSKSQPHSNGEQLRRMILAMVKDLRVVLIKLAWQLQHLRLLAQSDDRALQIWVAKQTLEVYAPLASRLGISQIKWELEDLSFRFQQPEIYRRIAKALANRRVEREAYIEQFIQAINDILTRETIPARVSGRPKHIYSIWRKMNRKHIEIDQLYDLRAIRIIVDKVETCYRVMNLVHKQWDHLEDEYDDYISNRKSNGYESIHTVILGPENHYIEIQIRTYEMHKFAESGVASHWNYKEGGKASSRHHQVVDDLRNSLKELLELNHDDDEYLLEAFHKEVFADRIFVMTPKGQVIELAKGSTPLDFAYAIHTDIGHRCIGAKVNGSMVGLDHELKTGEQVEIITGKEPRPKFNWLNTKLGYARSSRTRQKINHWFHQQDHEKNRQNGLDILEYEKHILNLPNLNLAQLTKQFGKQTEREFLIALGRGDITNQQLTETLLRGPDSEIKLRKVRSSKESVKVAGGIEVAGVKDLHTQTARCCKPVYGDSIIGFITHGRGVSVHRAQCANIINLTDEQQARLIEVSWGQEGTAYIADIVVTGYRDSGLLRDITQILFKEHISVASMQTRDSQNMDLSIIDLTIQIERAPQLADMLERIMQIPAVIDAQRKISP